jgi:hypothetical protein
MVTLDNSPSRPLNRQRIEKLGFPNMQVEDENKREKNALINQALISAVHAFSARWLPSGHFRNGNETSSQEELTTKEHFIESLWQRAHKNVLAVLTRPSYRSILALYLFGTTPTSFKNKERGISDHCLETSLRHYVQLKARACVTAKFPSSTGVQNYDTMDNSPAEMKVQEEYNHLADTAYWFGIVIDGSRSLTRCQPSVLLPGLNGQSQVWDIVKKQSDSFDSMYRSLQSSKPLLTDEMVMTIIQYGSSCKTLFWKAVSRVQDFFFYQTVELSLKAIMEDVVREMNRFEDVFGAFLDQCGRDYVLLSEKSRISYCESIMVNTNWG